MDGKSAFHRVECVSLDATLVRRGAKRSLPDCPTAQIYDLSEIRKRRQTDVPKPVQTHATQIKAANDQPGTAKPVSLLSRFRKRTPERDAFSDRLSRLN